MRKSLTLLAFALLCTIATFAQTVLVQGQVTDDRGPVPNATVQEKGTKNITRADELGKFSFKVKQGSLVVVTAVGAFWMAAIADACGGVNICDWASVGAGRGCCCSSASL